MTHVHCLDSKYEYICIHKHYCGETCSDREGCLHRGTASRHGRGSGCCDLESSRLRCLVTHRFQGEENEPTLYYMVFMVSIGHGSQLIDREPSDIKHNTRQGERTVLS
jgi:hypothetical protein